MHGARDQRRRQRLRRRPPPPRRSRHGSRPRRPSRRWHAAATHDHRSRSSPRPTAAARSPATPRAARRANGGTFGDRTPAPTSPIVVAALTNGKTYTCTVHATNANGDGSASVASACAVIPATVPARPPQPTVDARQRVRSSVAFARRQQRRQRDHRLHRELHVERRRRTRLQHRRDVADRRDRPHQRQDLHVHRPRDQRRRATATRRPPPPRRCRPPRRERRPRRRSTAATRQIIGDVRRPGEHGGSAITGYTASCTSSNGGVSGSQHRRHFADRRDRPRPTARPTRAPFIATNADGDGPASPASASAVPATVPTHRRRPTPTRGNAADHR